MFYLVNDYVKNIKNILESDEYYMILKGQFTL